MLLKMAWRSLRRHRSRTLLTAGAMTASVALLLVTLAIVNGMFDDLLSTSTRQYTGHLVVEAKGYREEMDLYLTLPDPANALERTMAAPGVIGASPRLRVFGLLSLGEETAPAEFLGVDPARERGVTTLQNHLKAGTYSLVPGSGGILIGSGIARRLAATVGDRLVFLTQAADGSMANELMTVEGIFETGDFGHDNSLALVPLPDLQSLMVMEGGIHEISVLTTAPGEAAAVSQGVVAALAGTDGVEVLPWQRIIPVVAEVIAMYDLSVYIMIFVLYFAAGTVFFNTLTMNFMERKREFAVMLAVGTAPGMIRWLLLIEAALMGMIAILLGTGFGFLGSLYLDRVGIDLSGLISPISYGGATLLPILHGMISWGNVRTAAWAMLLVSIVAALPAIRRVSGINPARALQGREA
jgi:ABC-type lipoprotein release transport system permease subunit